MSDTQLFRRITVTGSFKAMLLYVVADACVSLGQSFTGMDHATWEKQWWLQKVGFFLSQIGSTALMIKAFYSGSSPKTSISTSTNS